MRLFDKLLGFIQPNEQKTTGNAPSIRFGRYSDAYKNNTQYDAWDESLRLFEEERYLDAYRTFFKYLRDEIQDNVHCIDENKGVRFEILQGSKRIIGFADAKKFKAEVRVAKAIELHIGMMRRLVEGNFDLRYGRFALDPENHIVILFDTYAIDASPYKLYYGLKEIAIKADKEDDLLLEEFNTLQSIDENLQLNQSDTEKEIKYNYIIKEIKHVFQEIDEGKLSTEQYPEAVAYQLMSLAYKLDYLVKPEGFMLETVEEIHNIHFSNETKTTSQKNTLIRREMQRLLERSKTVFYKEMYNVRSTFGITPSGEHEQIVNFIDRNRPNIDWYKTNGHSNIALALCSYIIGYFLFNHAVPKPDKDLFHLYFEVLEKDYFQQLGFEGRFYNEQGVLDKKNVLKAIKEIIASHHEKYPDLSLNTNLLKYDSIENFAISYLLMLQNMTF